ncbi:MAG: oxidoreductase [Bdellovibrio sp.]|nr:MAG: oxidoreductase [Bdellovibrio sp.]
MVHKEVVLVTGCNSGLGLALANHLYHCERYRTVVTARGPSFDELKARFKESEDFHVRELDVTNDQQISSLVNSISIEWGGVDILINNAGVCYRGVVEHMDEESELMQIRTNYLGPLSLIRMVLPAMREKRAGKIVNVSSVSGMMAMPTMASYSASKFALEGATEALWYETRPFGISVCLVQPGFIHSDSFRKVRLSNKALFSRRLSGPHSEFYADLTPFIERLMHVSNSTPEAIAAKIVRLIGSSNPPLRTPVTRDALLFTWLRRYLPRNLFHQLMFKLLPGSGHWGVRHENPSHR